MKEGLTIGQLSEINAELHTEIAALKKQRDALAVENAGLKQEEIPLGAIENGRAFADRLEAYPFECQGGSLNMCSDWQELRRCFEYLSEWAMHSKDETPATDAAIANIQAQGVEKYGNLTIKIGEEEQDSDVIYAGKQALLFAAQLRKESNHD